jgi:hypothetical protein
MGQPCEFQVKAAIADHFAVFNKFYSAVPSWSTPNHGFAQVRPAAQASTI